MYVKCKMYNFYKYGFKSLVCTKSSTTHFSKSTGIATSMLIIQCKSAKKDDLMGKLYTLFILHYVCHLSCSQRAKVLLAALAEVILWFVYLRKLFWIYIVHHSHTCVCVCVSCIILYSFLLILGWAAYWRFIFSVINNRGSRIIASLLNT